MARVMRDATVAATAEKIFAACGPSWLGDSYNHWSAAVKAWAVGATRSLPDDDRRAIVYKTQELDDALMAARRALEEEDDE
ncbi:hypothetical protein NN6n1_35740 [Shinella zoogloeoides]